MDPNTVQTLAGGEDWGEEESAPQPHSEAVWADKAMARKVAFALWLVGGLGFAFLLSAGSYVALVVLGDAEGGKSAAVFASLMTGVIPTLTGTIAGYILNEKRP